MKIDKLENVEGFLKVVDSCKGEVELVTGEGDRLNLKSKLSQIVSLASIFPQLHEIPNVEIIAHEPEDMEKLAGFLFQ
ncbi:MAG: polya polymerase [Lachnospiraceae bacterium]|nr:polya polymerase [Lachnospiraceae bacterium]